MDDQLAPALDRLVAHLEETARGPKRNGTFAMWLVVRACQGELPASRLSSRARRRRLSDLERRLSSLSMSTPLKRALASGVRYLGEQTPEASVTVLASLVTPAREHLGAEVGEALKLAVKGARSAVDPHSSTSA